MSLNATRNVETKFHKIVQKTRSQYQFLWININATWRSLKSLIFAKLMMFLTAFRLKFNHFRQPQAFDNYSREPTLFNSRFQFATVKRIIFAAKLVVSCADFASLRKDNCGQFSSCCCYCGKRTCLVRLAPTENGRGMLNAFGIYFGLSTYGNREKSTCFLVYFV